MTEITKNISFGQLRGREKGKKTNTIFRTGIGKKHSHARSSCGITSEILHTVLSTQRAQAGTGVGRESHCRQPNLQEVSSLSRWIEPADEIIILAAIFSFHSETFIVLQYKYKMLTVLNNKPLDS